MHVSKFSFLPYQPFSSHIHFTFMSKFFSMLHLKSLPPTSTVYFSLSLSLFHIHTFGYSLTLHVANAGWRLSWEHIFDSFLSSLAAKTQKLAQKAEEVQTLEGKKKKKGNTGHQEPSVTDS